MKRHVLIFAAVLVSLTAILLVVLGPRTQKEPQPIVAAGDRCFAFDRAATESEPYAVSERVSISIEGDAVSGAKSGTQHGPGMSNGYWGTLSGSRDGDLLRVAFAYTIEGSQNTEREVYRLEDETLTKLRWALREEGGILVPDESGDPTLIPYRQIDCATNL